MPINSVNLKLISESAALVTRHITAIRESLAFFRARGVERDRLIAMLDQHETDGTDFTDLEMAVLFDEARSEVEALLKAAGEDAPAPLGIVVDTIGTPATASDDDTASPPQ